MADPARKTLRAELLPGNEVRFPPEMPPAERRAELERLARQHALPTLGTWEEWDAQFADLGLGDEPVGQQMFDLVTEQRAADRARERKP